MRNHHFFGNYTILYLLLYKIVCRRLSEKKNRSPFAVISSGAKFFVGPGIVGERPGNINEIRLSPFLFFPTGEHWTVQRKDIFTSWHTICCYISTKEET
ncbi:MAG: hypothetical protein JSV88_20465 [Candidatus Aminicenantes bacterium]|nr:MAG: hypothetical protein JSV88_20465 [Candidatus Aminicenantes bacterium]